MASEYEAVKTGENVLVYAIRLSGRDRSDIKEASESKLIFQVESMAELFGRCPDAAYCIDSENLKSILTPADKIVHGHCYFFVTHERLRIWQAEDLARATVTERRPEAEVESELPSPGMIVATIFAILACIAIILALSY